MVQQMSSEIEQIPAISHSLEADMVTGWKPKLKIIGPMPLNFDNPSIDKSILALLHQESAFYQVVYLGPRPNSSFKLHQLFAKRYRYKYSYLLHNDFAHLKPFFKKFYSLFEPEVKRPFHGMHPSISRRELIFDSCFQGGNLDCAVRLKANQYDLLLRVDSNTVGHVLWYHFRVTNPENTQKIVRFNLCNLRKNKSAYERGMRPYVKRHNHDWLQQGDNLELNYQRLKYLKHNLTANMEQNQLNQPDFYRKFGFSLSLQPGQSIEIAYSVPYNYSQLLEDLKQFRKKAQSLQGVQLEIDYEHESLSGLEIPILKIHSGPSGNGKYCVFVIGRQHPGEANCSYVLRGAINQILSSEEISMKLLNHCDFVIIPMVNPDGVVAGNFRTSLFGRDLNRLFKSKDTTLIPQIEMVRSVFTEQYNIYKKKLLLFLDYHGHSTRKNAFVLGPGIADAHLLNQIRILPKIMANSTQMFRYPSCSFRLDSNKKTTARALFGKLAGLSFTIETSNWAYYSSVTKEVVLVQAKHLQELGEGLQRAIQQFVLLKLEAKGKYEFRVREEASKKIKMMKSRQELKSRKSVTSRDKYQNNRTNKQPRIYTESVIGERENNSYKLTKIIEQHPSSVKEANSSDEMSQNGMDSESQAEDMENIKFKKYIKAATEMLVQFQMIYYGDLYNKGISKYKLTNNSKSNKLLFQSDKRKKIEPIQACLRQSERKPQSSFKSEEQAREQRPTRKKIFMQDVLFQKYSHSKPKIQTIHQENNDLKKEGKRFKLIQPSRKGKINITSVIRGNNALTEEQTHFQKIEFVNLVNNQRSIERRKFQPSLEKKSPKSNNIRLVVNQHKEPSSGLPFIRGSKVLHEQGSSNISSSNLIGPKAKDRFTDLIVSEQLMNKSTVVNVLKLSRIQKDKSFKNS